MNNNIKQILDDLAATSSKNGKSAILQHQRDNELLQRVLSLACNNGINFWTKAVVPCISSLTRGSVSLESALNQLMSEINTRKITGHDARDFLSQLEGDLSLDDSDVFQRVVAKDLKCGVGAGSINKIWPGLIFEWPVMLCDTRDQKNSLPFPHYAQTKQDGLRVNLVWDGSTQEPALYTRAGNWLDAMSTAIATDVVALKLQFPEGFMIDGELLSVGEQAQYLDRKTSNGLANKANRGTISDAEREKFVVVAWDVIGHDVFREKVKSAPYRNRLEALTKALRDNKGIRLIDTVIVDDEEELMELYALKRAAGLEGLIIKSFDGLWQNKRVRHQLKMKAEHEADLRILDCIEGKGKAAGMLGAFILGTDDGLCITKCGSGPSDADRISIWQAFCEEPDRVRGKICSVLYNTVIDSKSRPGIKSLFLPIFVEIRMDKFETDTTASLKI